MFTDYYILNSDYTSDWLAVKDLAERLVHAHPAQCLKTMVGQSLEKRKALTHPYPACIDKINKYFTYYELYRRADWIYTHRYEIRMMKKMVCSKVKSLNIKELSDERIEELFVKSLKEEIERGWISRW